MMTSFTILMVVAVILAVSVPNIVIQANENGENKKICIYLDQQFKVGELVTGSKCDRCFCTQHGIMCEMIKCDMPQCHDMVMGDCCMECPNGRNCLHEGENSTVLVPETGCLYSESVVCHCDYEENSTEGYTRCLPGNEGPPCEAYMP